MKPKNRKLQYLIALILFVATLAFLLCYYNYVEDSTAAIEQKKGELTTIANIKTQQIINWRHERVSDAKYLSGNIYMRKSINKFCANPHDTALKNEITSVLMPYMLNNEYSDVIIVSNNNSILLSLSGKVPGVSATEIANIKNAASTEVFFTDFYLNSKDSAAISIIIPFNCSKSDGCGLCATSIILKIDPYHNLYPLIDLWPLERQSAGIALVEKDATSDSVLYLTSLQKKNKPALKYKISLTDTMVPAVKAVLGKTGLYFAKDYHGTDVLAHSDKIPGTPWYIITKVATSEINQPVAEAQRWFAISIIIIGLLITISFWMIWSRNNAKNLRKLLEAEQHEAKAIAENLLANQKFRLLAEQSGVQIGLFDKNGHCIYCNERALITLGERGKDYERKSFTELFGEEAGKRFLKRFEEAMASDTPLVFDDKSSLTENTWIHSNVTRIIDADGTIAGIQIVSHDITERKQMELDLIESEFFFRESQQAAMVGSYKADFVADRWTSSEVLDQIFGIDKNYTRSVQGWLDTIHPDDREMMNKYLTEEVFEKQQSFNKEYRVQRISDKAELWVLGLGQIGFDAHGKVITLIGTIQDITERKLAEEEATSRNKMLQVFIKNSPIYTFIKEVTATESKVIMANDKFAEMIGISGSEMIGKNMYELFPKDFAAKMTAEDWEVVSNNEELLLEKEFKNRYYATIKFPINLGGKRLLAGYTIDITERKLSEKIMFESEEKFRTLYNVAPVPLALNDADFNILLLNDEFKLTFGYTLADIPTVDAWWPKAYPDEEYREWVASSWRQRLNKARETSLPFEPMELEITAKNGSVGTYIVGLSFMGEFETSSALIYFHDITQRNHSEALIIESEQKFRAVFESSNVGKSLTEVSGKVQPNEAFCKMLGYSYAEMTSTSWQEISFPDEIDSNQAQLDLLLSNEKKSVRFEKRYIHKNGSIVWADVSFTLSRDKHGNPQLYIATILDISERKKIEKTFYDIVDMNPMSIQIVDLQGITLHVNPANLKLFGLLPPENFSIFDTLQARYPEITEYIIQAKSGKVVHLPDIHYNTRDYGIDLPDNPVWISATIFPLLDQNGIPEKHVLMHENITERKESEAKLIESEGRFRTTFMTANDAMYLSTLEEGLILIVNDSFETVFGYNPSEAINKTTNQLNLFHDPLIRKDIVAELKLTGMVKDKEIKVRKKNGEMIDVSVSLSSMQLDNTPHIMGIVRDISFRKQSEQLLREKMNDLEKTNESMIDREIKMIELKKEINELLVALGREEKHTTF